ncbi:Rieske 2Fe-2S domain-containing protein [cyanobacterium endosymbiont of Epithemia clementina EcSB]|uniref:Rieske 2Fe-2S domain-containing protein n=1 Tax=cyanobacterium endosymbiont of Epithemia clementina EcSB TaxID=3034674 RepID=UPI002481073B|nr:Rieske 2Fe-2S domain-containing protein [cyanobacterium endosymbiont of Epithemia clementina EcSB]WGT67620.1 Rieske 2Fe-2S domain-containing protein [cyanobacterium endosymbiont of Epithemia clementina EcSB]
MTTLLRDFWYVALPGKQLKPGKMVHKKMLGEPILVGRRKDGEVFAIRDICPHRGIPLQYGSMDGDNVCCRYHGWKFSTHDGSCREIPSLTEYDDLDISRIRVPTYACQEVQGNIWVYFAMDTDKGTDLATIPPVPTIPDFGKIEPGISEVIHFVCNIDHATIGLMDPAHGPHIHSSWWWRSGPQKFRVKEKQYEPVTQGFRLVPYDMPVSARPYKLLGDRVSIEIIFELPSVRIEILRGDRYSACLLTTITPIDENECEAFQSIYWTIPWMGVFKPLLRFFTRQFLAQDRDAVIQQREGLSYNPALMLIDDADTQAKWYFRLKQEYQKSKAENRLFKNPVESRMLRWRS